MKYYILEIDKEYLNAPQLKNWLKELGVSVYTKSVLDAIPKRKIFFIEPNANVNFTSMIIKPFFLVKTEIRDCILMYEPNLQFKEFFLVDRDNSQMEQYYLPMLKEIDCVMEWKDESVQIKGTAINDKAIFRIWNSMNSYVVVRMDLLESILMRKGTGFLVRELIITESRG